MNEGHYVYVWCPGVCGLCVCFICQLHFTKINSEFEQKYSSESVHSCDSMECEFSPPLFFNAPGPLRTISGWGSLLRQWWPSHMLALASPDGRLQNGLLMSLKMNPVKFQSSAVVTDCLTEVRGPASILWQLQLYFPSPLTFQKRSIINW